MAVALNYLDPSNEVIERMNNFLEKMQTQSVKNCEVENYNHLY